MSVQTAQVSVLSGEIRNGANAIQQELQNLESKVTKLRSQWSGEAQTSYDRAQLEWSKSLEAMRELLGKIAASTEQIGQAYNESDTRNANRF
jgi:WXG100 family type VII secretion target